jgi:GGDEF domain-containing protein
VLRITCSIGIVLTASSQDPASERLRKADPVMYRAKKKGKARYEMFDPSMNVRALNRLGKH